MYPSLMTSMLGIRANLEESIGLAARHGFIGVDSDGSGLAALNSDDIAHIRAKFEQTNTRPGYISMPPGRFPVAEDDWQSALTQWPSIARNAHALGYERMGLVLLPFHETLTLEAALDEHVRRLREIVPILAQYNLRLALEYVAAPSRRAAYATHTVWNLAGLKELLARVDSRHLGIMLDTFHWHGAGESAADLKTMTQEEIVVVHANDAPHCALDEQVVTQRALPGATGAIDSVAFFETLKQLGYNGPVTCEPMQPAIEALGIKDADDLCERVGQTLRQAMGE